MLTYEIDEMKVGSVNLEKIALELFEARRSGRAIACFAEGSIGITNEEGYLIQEMIVEKSRQSGEEVKGYKVGLTSKETQRMYSTEKPFYGTLTDGNIIIDHGIKAEALFEPFVIEMELVFIMTEDLPPMATEKDILANTLIAPGLEIPDGRYINWTKNKNLASIIADVGAAGRVAVGEPVRYSSISDLSKIKSTLYWEEEKLEDGYGEAVLGNPINSMIWLSKELALQGKTLRKGMIVSSGTLIMPKPIKKGKYQAVFQGIGEVSLQVE